MKAVAHQTVIYNQTVHLNYNTVLQPKREGLPTNWKQSNYSNMYMYRYTWTVTYNQTRITTQCRNLSEGGCPPNCYLQPNSRLELQPSAVTFVKGVTQQMQTNNTVTSIYKKEWVEIATEQK
jgi:hypothetical protein